MAALLVDSLRSIPVAPSLPGCAVVRFPVSTALLLPHGDFYTGAAIRLSTLAAAGDKHE